MSGCFVGDDAIADLGFFGVPADRVEEGVDAAVRITALRDDIAAWIGYNQYGTLEVWGSNNGGVGTFIGTYNANSYSGGNVISVTSSYSWITIALVRDSDGAEMCMGLYKVNW